MGLAAGDVQATTKSYLKGVRNFVVENACDSKELKCFFPGLARHHAWLVAGVFS